MDPGLHPEIKGKYANFCTEVEEANDDSRYYGGKLYRSAIADQTCLLPVQVWKIADRDESAKRAEPVKHSSAHFIVALKSCSNAYRRTEDEEEDDSEVVRQSIEGIESLFEVENWHPKSISEVVYRIFLTAAKLEPSNADALKVQGSNASAPSLLKPDACCRVSASPSSSTDR
eukprot:767776-Hanusia_phi.AAC.5